MKKRLYLKLLIGYVIFGILGFILVSTFSSHYTYEYIEDTEVDRLYKEANMIASTYASNYFNEDITVDDLHDSLTTLSTYLSSEIWVMNTDGDILINSNASVDMDHLTHIDGFNVADFGSRYYTTINRRNSIQSFNSPSSEFISFACRFGFNNNILAFIMLLC